MYQGCYSETALLIIIHFLIKFMSLIEGGVCASVQSRREILNFSVARSNYGGSFRSWI